MKPRDVETGDRKPETGYLRAAAPCLLWLLGVLVGATDLRDELQDLGLDR
jgi:hypothetical protein